MIDVIIWQMGWGGSGMWNKLIKHNAEVGARLIAVRAKRAGLSIEEVKKSMLPEFERVVNQKQQEQNNPISPAEIVEMAGADVSATEPKTFAQPMIAGIDLNERVPVLDLSDVLTTASTKADLQNIVNEIAKKGEPIPTLNEDWFIDILNRSKKKSHVIASSRAKKMRNDELDRHKKFVANMDGLIRNSMLIESAKNTKQGRKKDVDFYYYFYVPVRIGEDVFVMNLTAEQMKGDKTIKPQTVHLFDILEIKKMRMPPSSQNDFNRSYYDGDTVSIAQMLTGVKDNGGTLYFQSAQTAGAKPNEVEDAKKEWRDKKTDSKYFNKFFKKSAAVDENGKPLLLYTGSRTGGGFSEFEGETFMTPDKDVAEMFASEASYTLTINGKKHLITNRDLQSIKDTIEPYDDDFIFGFNDLAVLLDEEDVYKERFLEVIEDLKYHGIIEDEEIKTMSIKKTTIYILFTLQYKIL